MFFFFNDTATTEIYTLSLHDALPIYEVEAPAQIAAGDAPQRTHRRSQDHGGERHEQRRAGAVDHRSEEHTSELQSPCNLVCRLLLEKKKKHQTRTGHKTDHPQSSN